ncbi:MAG: permease-like cell division protein FtsX [Prevotellaceae bacterium]|jgi:cell division transport system permease protein|nr:permease-like cell division protein FtsX [Prevotellaceae bacterium]
MAGNNSTWGNPYTSRRLRNSYVSTVVSMSLVLFMLGLMGILLLNASRLSRYVKENISISVILQDNATEADIAWLRKQLDMAPYVRETKFISKEDGERELREMLGEDFVAFLGYNPLPVSIEAKLRYRYANNDSIQNIERELKWYNQVKEVTYQKSLINVMNDNINKISALLLLFSGLLFFVSMAQINNTIRLSIYARRFLINTMKLVGATNAFITRPFIAKNAFHGVLAAIIAMLLLCGLIYAARNEMGREMIQLVTVEVMGILLFCLLAVGLAVGAISTYFAVNKFLDMKTDELYY